MSNSLTAVLKNVNLGAIEKPAGNLISLLVTKSKGIMSQMAVLDNGLTGIKKSTSSGIIVKTVVQTPKINSIAQRSEIIKDLHKLRFTQTDIAAMVDVSQSTVSRTLNN